MNEAEKLLAKASNKECEQILKALRSLELGKWAGLSVKKLSGVQDTYRLRVGKFRIIFRHSGGTFELLTIRRRNEKTYRDF